MKKFLFKKIILNIVCLTVLLFIPMFFVSAQVGGTTGKADLLKDYQANLQATGEQGAGFDRPTLKSISEAVGTIVSAVLGFVGVIFLGLMIYAGMLWMTASGNEEKTKKAKTIMTEAIIGLGVTLAAYIITRTVVAILA